LLSKDVIKSETTTSTAKTMKTDPKRTTVNQSFHTDKNLLTNKKKTQSFKRKLARFHRFNSPKAPTSLQENVFSPFLRFFSTKTTKKKRS
jgi:hypothetical protein